MRLLASRGTLVIDGALATELEERGLDLNHALWSAKVLQEQPESIEKVHLDYFIAGADIAITASYQATPRGLSEQLDMTDEESRSLISRSVTLARNARTAAYASGVDRTRRLLVAGSVGPFGAYLADGSEYRGDYTKTVEEYQSFHRPRVQALLAAGVDILALETMPNFCEIRAIVDLLHAEFPSTVAWLACTIKDPSHLSDGTPLQAVLSYIHENDLQIMAFGVNCVPLDTVPETLKHLSQSTCLPLLCYPNSGETWDAQNKTWHGKRPDDELNTAVRSNQTSLLSPAALWIKNGARLIGGCCRTGPAFIRAIRADLDTLV